MPTHSGSCHCGAVAFRVEADLDEETLLDCNCSICRRKGYLHLIVEPERFELLRGEDQLREYRFNTETAVHRFCTTCGIHAFYTPRSHPDDVSVNGRCLEGVAPEELNTVPFDGRNWERAADDLRKGNDS